MIPPIITYSDIPRINFKILEDLMFIAKVDNEIKSLGYSFQTPSEYINTLNRCVEYEAEAYDAEFNKLDYNEKRYIRNVLARNFSAVCDELDLKQQRHKALCLWKKIKLCMNFLKTRHQ